MQYEILKEINNYRQAVNTFYAANGRFPGDINNTGKFGLDSGYTYSKTDFKPPYDTGDFVPNVRSAPWIELYTEEITDFKPSGNKSPGESSTQKDIAQPASKIFKGVFYGFAIYQPSADVNNFLYEISPNSKLYYNSHNYNEKDAIDSKITKTIDDKLDDGEHNSGTVRAGCYGSSSLGNNTYQNAIDNNRKCAETIFDLFIQ